MSAAAVNENNVLRKVRVFISSTFLDMQEERDALNRVVFPYLRSVCNRVQIEFVGVDLRWGITEEEAKQGKTIDICFKEIEECHPFFIGILGERYGWIPPKKLRAKHMSLFGDGTSVTEAEMEVGVLRRPPETVKAVFCIRDGSLTDRLGFGGEKNNDTAARLDALKARIRKSGFPTLDGYTSVEEFCDFVKARMESMIASVFPPPAETDGVDAENRAQDFYARQLDSDFIGRESFMPVLDEYARSGGQPLLLTGKAGSGKSALLAHWVLSYGKRRPRDFVFAHFCKADGQASDWAFLVRRLMNALKPYCDSAPDVPEERGALIYALPRFLSSAAVDKIIIAIDEAEILDAEDSFGLTWIPAELPGNVRVVITAKKQAAGFLRSRGYREIRMPALSRDEQLALIDTYLPNLGKRFDDVLKQIAVSRSITKTPVYLKTLLHELSITGKHELLTQQLQAYLQAPDTAALYAKVLDRIENGYNTPDFPHLVRDVSSLLYCSQQGLSESRLVAALKLPQLVWYPLYLALQPYLLAQGEALTPAHDGFRLAIKAKYGLNAPAIRKIRVGLAAQLREEPEAADDTLALAWLYRKAGLKSDLCALLCDIGRIIAFEAQINLLKRYWIFVEKGTRHRSDERYAAIDESATFPQIYVVVKFLLETGKYRTAKSILDRYTDKTTDGDAASLQTAYGLIGRTEHKLGHYRAAKKAYAAQLKICEQAGDDRELARTYGNIGNLEAESGYFGKALDMYGRSMDLFKKAGELDGVQNALGNIASVLTQTGRYDEAEMPGRERERICRESRNDYGLIAALGNLSNLYLATGRHDDARACLDEQEEICGKLGDPEQRQEIYGRRAIILAERSSYAAALDYFTQKLTLSKKIGYYDGEQLALYNLARLYLLKGDPARAEAAAGERKALCYERLNSYDYADASLQLARIYVEGGDSARAAGALEELGIFARMHDYHGIAKNAEELLLEIRKG